MRFVQTDDDGNHLQEVKEAYLEGYGFGDRLLEGVWFGFMIENGNLEAFVHPDHYSYMSKFNIEHHLKLAVEYALQQDLFATSPDADDDAVILIQD